MEKLCFALCGAFFEHQKALEQIKLLSKNYDVIPIVSECVATSSKDLLKKLKQITGNDVISSLFGAEQICKKQQSTALIVCPCTGNTLAKIACAITDNTVTMLSKAHMRNNKPIIIAISTNDGLGLNFFNIAKLMNEKNIYFVPFGQDNANEKPKSLVSDFSQIENTLRFAIGGEQIQPILL